MVEGKWSGTMMNIMEINGYRAVVQYDPEIEMFRGEFIGLNGGADFYAKDIEGLRKEGEISLKVFLDMCQEDGVEPRKEYSGRFNLRVSPELHAEIATRAAAAGKSLNQWVADALDESVKEFAKSTTQ
jgi:predicted HicB family RNase H-like nuclease